ncbi:glycosyltransferase family 4 protein [Sutcliffiella horikoshii]|uniref:glycosyltransferase family 4 protein n=1 Tax=Sutcliffiella horikoshii TaxID=79883 RepID=UPI003CE82271
MNILFLSIGRLNNIEDRGIYTDLLREFKNNGHNVYVVSPREKRLNKDTEYINESGIHFLRVKIGNITKVGLIEKGISTVMIESLFLGAIKKYMNDVCFDLIIYSTPPITFEKLIRYVKQRDNARSYLLLKDIFPHNAVDLQILSKKNPLYWYFKGKEKKLYKSSDYIGCMSQANVDFILKHNPEISPEKVEVCPNSLEPLEVNKDETIVKKIKEKYNIPFDKTVFIYGGNLGKPQGIDFLIKCLEANEYNGKVFFVIAGSGTEFNKLKAYFNSNNPNNAQLFEQLPREDYETLANSCDVGLIFLDRRFTIPNFPSRLLSYMQASMPVLAATDVNTDIGKVIEEGEFGYWCESNNVKDFNQKVAYLCDVKLQKTMGENARKYLENNYTVKHSYEIIMNHFK